MKKEVENQRRERKEMIFLWGFYEVLTFFFWFSELDTGISRISRLVPDEEGR